MEQEDVQEKLHAICRVIAECYEAPYQAVWEGLPFCAVQRVLDAIKDYRADGTELPPIRLYLTRIDATQPERRERVVRQVSAYNQNC